METYFFSLEQQLDICCIHAKELNILNSIDENKLIKFNYSYIVCWLNDDRNNRQKSEVKFNKFNKLL